MKIQRKRAPRALVSLFFDVRQQSHETGALDGGSQMFLVVSFGPGNASWQDFTSVGDESLQQLIILEIYVIDFVFCEIASFTVSAAVASVIASSHDIPPS